MHEPVLLIDDADVINGDTHMLIPTVPTVNVPADHELRPNPLNRREQLATADVPHLT